MRTRVPILLVAVFAMSIGLWAADDPLIGTWKLNVAKSKYEPGPPTRSNTLKFEAVPNGYKQSNQGTDAQGNPTASQSTAYYDGKDYPVTGQQNWDTQALKRIDANTTLIINKKGGNVVRMARRAISQDGRTMTTASVGIDAQGRATHNVAAYDRQ